MTKKMEESRHELYLPFSWFMFCGGCLFQHGSVSLSFASRRKACYKPELDRSVADTIFCRFLELTSGFFRHPDRRLGRTLFLALVDVELRLDGRLCVPHVRVPRELGVTAFTDSEHGNISDSLYDPEIALRHEASVPQVRERRYPACGFQTAPLPASGGVLITVLLYFYSALNLRQASDPLVPYVSEIL